MKKILLTVLLLSIGLTGCAVNPVTGKNELSLVSEAQELQIGKQNYAPMRQAQGGDYAVDKQLTAYVSEVGQKLAAVSDRKLPYEFKVLNSSVPNAWTLPGGKIALNRGLLTELESEAELAAVLGHEIVHSAAKHTARSMSRGVLMQGAVLAAVIGTQGKDYAQLAQLGAGVGAQLVTQKYGRDAEREADFYGMKYMAKAGYDPQGAVDLQKTFVRLSEGRRQDWLSGLFASHPPSQERVNNNIKALADLPKGGIKGVSRFKSKTAHLKRTKPAYEAYDKGRKALSKGNTSQARTLAQKAIRIEPREGDFYALLGDIEEKNNNPRAAKRHYDKAINLNSNYFYYYLKRGIMNEALNATSSAKQDLEKSVKLLPTANAYNSLGNIAKRQGDYAQAKAYYTKAAGNDSAVGKSAYGSLIELDLGDNPGKYLKLRTGLDSSGRLKAEISNPTPKNVRDVVVAIQYQDVNGRTRQIKRPFRGTLRAGSKEVIDLGLHNIPKEKLRTIKTGIIGAKVAR
ncbi:MAG TPA: tetratricopeptide repeat protein [Chromatiales bacterium]|nr:tetratricopeptide repeat protein [Thiotrichales bacterium]HIP68044.1 tetratricopeptide repeat protein [Chromatiales bacterium]